MSAAMVRAGGIAALAMVPTVLVLGFLLVGGIFAAAFNNPDGEAIIWLLTPLLYLVFVAVAVFVFWTTRGLFRALGYAAAEGCFVITIGLLLLGLPLVVLPWTWFAILAIRFGRQIGSRLWQAIGAIYLATMVLVVASLVSAAFTEYRWPDFDLLGLALAAFFVGWSCHGIGLIVNAGRIART